MKTIKHRPILKAIIADLLIFGFFCALLCWLGAYNFCYMEHLGTFYYDIYNIVTQTIKLPGGMCMVIADFLTQFFLTPALGVLISASILTLIAILIARILRFLSGTMAYTPLALIPTVTLAFLHYNVNYMYAGTIAFVMMLVAMNIMFESNYKLRFDSLYGSLLYTVAATFFLYATSSAAAMLFGILVILGCVLKNPKNTLYYLICPVMTVVQAWISVRSGLVCDMRHALTPDAFYNNSLEAPPIVGLPWIMTIVVYSVACILCFFNNYAEKIKLTLFWTLLVCACGFAVIGGRIWVYPEKETFKKYNCLVRAHLWDNVIHDYAKHPTPNLMIQNCLNLALAEKGLLADSIFSQNCLDIRNIYITGESQPYMNMLLSDVYFSMGHIALAQRHAFEANESLDNMSPRMLQRLVKTNIIFGNYKTADKYLKHLEKTLFYRHWAKRYRRLLNDEAVMADTLLGPKRACLFADNRFSAINGLDDDLLQIIRANPKHQATAQYLPTLYLLSKDLTKFRTTIDELHDAGVLPTPMPKAYQQGIMAIFKDDNDSIVQRYGIERETLDDYTRYKARPELNRKNFWYFYSFKL